MPGRGAKHLARLGWMPAQHLPDADATPDLGETVKHGARSRSSEVSESDVASGDARGLVKRLEPLDLDERIIGAVPGGFHMHGGDDVLTGGVAPVVANEIILPNRGEVAKRLNRASRRAKPWMPVHAEVPKMAMRVDDRSVIQFGHDGSSEVQAWSAMTPALPTRRTLTSACSLSDPMMQRVRLADRFAAADPDRRSNLCNKFPAR